MQSASRWRRFISAFVEARKEGIRISEDVMIMQSEEIVRLGQIGSDWVRLGQDEAIP